jgi:hypothetical protein
VAVVAEIAEATGESSGAKLRPLGSDEAVRVDPLRRGAIGAPPGRPIDAAEVHHLVRRRVTTEKVHQRTTRRVGPDGSQAAIGRDRSATVPGPRPLVDSHEEQPHR